jgi:hypothetical protein
MTSTGASRVFPHMHLSRIGPIALEGTLDGSPEGNVLRGVHLERNKKMAVKLLPRHLVNVPMGGDNFTSDVKVLQKLVHPGIARVYGGAMDDGQPYLAMEVVDGESLRSLLDRRGRLPWETTVDIAIAVCEALEYAHANRIVHQRLTPSRILLPGDGGVKLIGFDCKLADHDLVLGLRSPMSVAHYLSPEQFRGKESASLPAADVFSLGVIIYECLSGKLPWPANSPRELVEARRAAPAPRVSASVLECPVWLDVLVARLLETKRRNRLPTTDAARRAFLDAKHKAAQGAGAVQHAWAGKQGALATNVDRQELAALRKKQVTRQRDDSPFYEQAWFLAACLLAVIALGAWVLWPKSKEELLAAAAPLMASDDPVQWQRAESQYLADLRERFPETADDPAILEFEDRVALHRAEERVKNLDRFGRKPASEAERLYAEGWRKERFGDFESAWQLYDKVQQIAVDRSNADDRAYRTLAIRGVARIRTEADAQRESAEVVQEKLEEARDLIARKQTLPARRVLDDVITLYDGRRDMRALVDEARTLLEQLAPSP